MQDTLSRTVHLNFVARVEMATVARVSVRRHSRSYADELKSSEALDTTAISGRSRFSNA